MQFPPPPPPPDGPTTLSDNMSRTPLARTSATMVQPAQRHLPVLGQTPLLQGMLFCSSRDNTTRAARMKGSNYNNHVAGRRYTRSIHPTSPALARFAARHREARKGPSSKPRSLCPVSPLPLLPRQYRSTPPAHPGDRCRRTVGAPRRPSPVVSSVSAIHPIHPTPLNRSMLLNGGAGLLPAEEAEEAGAQPPDGLSRPQTGRRPAGDRAETGRRGEAES